MKRKIIKINEDKCNGCGKCIPNCPEGALQIIDGKARLVSDLFCDGLGACIGHCPEGAIKTEEREAEAYDEQKVMENIIKQGPNVIKAHLKHLRDHGESEFFQQAVMVLRSKGIDVPLLMPENEKGDKHPSGCPGARVMDFAGEKDETPEESGKRNSHLKQWPVQLHLTPPTAPFFQGADLVLAADCVAYSIADFHKDYLEGKALAIACPKLDSEQIIYEQKLISMIDDAKINTLTVMIMEVPCCSGLLALAKEAAGKAARKIPVKRIVVGIKGDIVSEEWM